MTTQITTKDIKTLKRKCPKCDGKGGFSFLSLKPDEYGIHECYICSGTGQGSIKIEKEWVECKDSFLHGKKEQGYAIPCKCKGKGKIPKYKVGEEIIIDDANKQDNLLKLKIISETGDKQRVIMVR